MFMIRVNEKPQSYSPGQTIGELASQLKPLVDIFIVNGFPCSPDTVLQDGDSCWLIRRGEVPDFEEMNRLLYARHTPGVQERVQKARVGVMGLGGLGSASLSVLRSSGSQPLRAMVSCKRWMG